jgi:Fe-S oxidoreductase
MALDRGRVTFWFGCNMLRHAEMIRLSIMLLERVGYDVNAAGGPAYCCGTVHDHQQRAASNMAAAPSPASMKPLRRMDATLW